MTRPGICVKIEKPGKGFLLEDDLDVFFVTTFLTSPICPYSMCATFCGLLCFYIFFVFYYFHPSAFPQKLSPQNRPCTLSLSVIRSPLLICPGRSIQNFLLFPAFFADLGHPLLHHSSVCCPCMDSHAARLKNKSSCANSRRQSRKSSVLATKHKILPYVVWPGKMRCCKQCFLRHRRTSSETTGK